MSHQRSGKVLRYGVELLVVFFGVWLGLLADNYRELRQDRAAERVSLERLSRDLEWDQTDFQKNLGLTTAGNEAALWILEHSDRSDVPRDSLEHHLTNLQFRAVLVANTSEYSSLTSAGRLNIIRNAELRQGFTELYLNYAYAASLHDVEQLEVRAAMEHVAEHVRLGTPGGEYGFSPVRLVSGPEMVLGNPGFLLAVSELAGIRTELQRGYGRLLERIEALQQGLREDADVR